MGVSVGGGKSSGSQKDPAATALANIAQQFAGETTPLRTGLISAFSQILSGQGTRLPVVSQAMESSRQAGSKATSDTSNELARMGLAGTPFGERVLSESRSGANQSTSQAGSNAIMQLFSMIPNFTLGQGQTALSGLGGAVGGNVSGKGKSSGFGMSGGGKG